MGEDAELLLLARAITEVLVVKRQTTLMAEHDFRRVLQAEHVGEVLASFRACFRQRVDHLFHNEFTIVDYTIGCDALRGVLAAKVDDAGVFLHHRVGKKP